MRYALIIAGGAGTRLWPMSRAGLPKQLIPFLGGKSLLQIAFERLEGLIPSEHRYICAGQKHAQVILDALPSMKAEQFLGEPTGRDTLNAVGLGAAVLAQKDPDAVIAVLTADHIIEPIDDFCRILEQGYRCVEKSPNTLLTFGIAPTGPATAYGYLELGESMKHNGSERAAKSPAAKANAESKVSQNAGLKNEARWVSQFREKPPLATAESYFQAGPEHYLWNSGMFVWRASTLLDCIRRYQPSVFDGLETIAKAWESPRRNEVLAEVYPTLKKISVDFAIMEPVTQEKHDGDANLGKNAGEGALPIRVAAIPMPLRWLDVGSWPSYAQTCPRDEQGNALAASLHQLCDSTDCLVASSEPDHLITTIGCHGLVVIHTKDATLVCPADQAEQIKELHKKLTSQFGDRYE